MDPPINPNKMNNYSSYLWDSKNSYNITTPDYIVMERGAENGNTWSLQNFWYTLGETLEDGTILTEELMQDSVLFVLVLQLSNTIKISN
ncbi:UNVERIFIED_ORG: hypothetical protein [Escherichia phage CMSTMSU]